MLAILTDGPLWNLLIQRALDERRISRATVCITNNIDRAVDGGRITAILALGDASLQQCYEATEPVTAIRGYLLPSHFGIPVVASYAPFYLTPRRSTPTQPGNAGAMHLFGVFMRDLQLAANAAAGNVPTPLPTNYLLYPTINDVLAYIKRLRIDSTLPVAYDLETAALLGIKGDGANTIIQIQFSSWPGHAIVLPWTGAYPALARQILALPNPKFGYNNRSFDDPLLEEQGCTMGGTRHDVMWAYAHLQPSFMANKEDGDADKAVPSRLMGLQSCTSFYSPEMLPWKHLSADPANIQYYGALDSDMTLRCGLGILASLEAAGLMQGYITHKLELRPVLDGLGRRGLPINREKQAELRAYVLAELATTESKLNATVPPAIRSVHPKDGHKGLPKVLRGALKAAGLIVPKQPPLYYWETAQEVCRQLGYETREFSGEQRLVKVLPFNPSGSSPNTLAYIRHCGYRVPTQIDDATKATTGKLELQKLADETGDAVLALVLQHRELRKVGMDYTGGVWLPAADGRVHAEFRWGTASGQLTAVRPPVQTFPEHSSIAKRAKAMIAAKPGHTFVKVDMTGFHARVAGWLADDPAYYRLASMDVHSFVVAHFLKLQGADYLLELPDDELRAELAIIKRMHSHVRNYKVKRCVHGITFGMQARKLYRMYTKELSNLAEAQYIIDLLRRLFPRTFHDFPEWVRQQITSTTRGRLLSPYGHWRTFYDFDQEQATAYLPSNCAHCHIQAALIRMEKAGTTTCYDMVNFTHDAGWFHPLKEQADECVSYVVNEFQAPSNILVDSPLGPFWCPADVEWGDSLVEMKPYG